MCKVALEENLKEKSKGYETKFLENVKILGGKTGYIYESQHCLASFAEKNGKEYIAVTVMGHGKYKPIYDAFELYGKYLN